MKTNTLSQCFFFFNFWELRGKRSTPKVRNTILVKIEKNNGQKIKRKYKNIKTSMDCIKKGRSTGCLNKGEETLSIMKCQSNRSQEEFFPDKGNYNQSNSFRIQEWPRTAGSNNN
jgi:hypothetical protein